MYFGGGISLRSISWRRIQTAWIFNRGIDFWLHWKLEKKQAEMNMCASMEWMFEEELSGVVILKESLCYIEPLGKKKLCLLKSF